MCQRAHVLFFGQLDSTFGTLILSLNNLIQFSYDIFREVNFITDAQTEFGHSIEAIHIHDKIIPFYVTCDFSFLILIEKIQAIVEGLCCNFPLLSRKQILFLINSLVYLIWSK